MAKRKDNAKVPDQKFDEHAVRATYARESGLFQSLCEEVHFILKRRLIETDIKIHGIEDRVKDINSLITKAKKSGCTDPIKEINDLAGIRVICLFRDDLPRIGALIKRNFRVLSEDNKLNTGDILGYQSVHYICELPPLTGARYEQITKTRFEIQIRTLCMHCWASVSHHIDYKGDWDVPKELKLALSALSGLFYVADTEFQQFNFARVKSRLTAEADQESKIIEDQEINFDTVAAYLKSKFPNREEPAASEISSFVRELVTANYTSISQLEKDMSTAAEAFAMYERDHPPGKVSVEDGDDDDDDFEYGEYNSLGAARLSLVIISDIFWETFVPAKSVRDSDNISSYRIKTK